MMQRILFLLLALVLPWCYGASHASTSKSAMKIDEQHVRNWNRFADDLYVYHQYMTANKDIRTEEENGGYAGLPNFYREVRYFDRDSNKLISRIQWENKNPKQIHVIEVFVYDKDWKLKSDYLAAFLPKFRNAPIQTLVNLHYKNDELNSFRQFDASGVRIYERCEGRFFGEPVLISLEEDDFTSIDSRIINTMESEEYLSCFEHVPHIASPYLSPLKSANVPISFVSANSKYATDREQTHDSLSHEIKRLTGLIETAQKPGPLLVKRGKTYFQLHEFEKAVQDYDHALKLDDSLDEAYFGRGMAKGRLGLVKQGIADLSVFIQRNPNDSRAYTKRGVRYIWAGDLEMAKSDLTRAIELDPLNAEAHDDLGVVYASKGQYQTAISHFERVIKIDPSYQKGFHNLAMAYHITGDKQKGLQYINEALSINPQEKTSLLLKGEILQQLGKVKEAQAIIERAEFLPDGNWSERFSLQQ